MQNHSLNMTLFANQLHVSAIYNHHQAQHRIFIQFYTIVYQRKTISRPYNFIALYYSSSFYGSHAQPDDGCM
jgi:hypothetical protein